MGSAAESAWYGFFMRQLRLEFFRYAKHLWSGNQVMLSLTLRALRFQLLF